MNALLEMDLDEISDLVSAVNDETTVSGNGDAFPNVLKEQYCIKDLASANWAFRKIIALQEKNCEYSHLIEVEKKRLDDWLEKMNHDNKVSIQFFESLLQDYFVQERIKDSKFKLSTPYGRVSSRRSDKWIYDDETLLKSLREAGLSEYIKVTESPKKDELKKAKELFGITENGNLVTKDGEIIDGVMVTNIESISVIAKP